MSTTAPGNPAASDDFIVGLDTGGTFTDCAVLSSATAQVVTSKALSTPQDFSLGLLESVGRAADTLGLDVEELLRRTRQLVVGTTVGTNAFLERTGADTGMIVTRGFRDTLAVMKGIGRVIGQPADQFLLLETSAKPEPIVPKHLIREVVERVDSDGEILLAPDRDAVLAAVAELIDLGIDALSVCFLWAFKQPENEQLVGGWIREAYPELYVSCSHEVAARIGEFERFAGTAINAYVGPKTERFLEHVSEAVRRKGYANDLLVMSCDGGVHGERAAAQQAIATMNSGPAGGVTGSGTLARALGLSNVITADVGGTSFDVGLIRDDEVQAGDKTVLGQYEFYVPTIDVQSIGAGGGSIAWIDDRRRTLRVGPQSAGGNPGPVCFGRGGSEPTLTDAALCLGYLSDDSFLGHGGKLDVEAARTALGRVGAAVDLSWSEAAEGIVRISEAQMSDLVRRMVISRGYDPRDFTVFAYGGAGPLHAAGFARDLELASIVVPAGNIASVWSAFGVATSDIKYVYEYAAVFGEPFDATALREVYQRLGRQARERLREHHISEDDTTISYAAGLRYRGQLHELYVPVADGESLDADTLPLVVEAFEREYARTYGEESAFRQAGVEIVAFRLTTVTPVDRPPVVPNEPDGGDALRGARQVRFTGLGEPGKPVEPIDTPVYDGERLALDAQLDGPCMIDLPGTTIVVAPDYRVARHESGSFVLTSVDRPASV